MLQADGTKTPGNWILPNYANTDCWKDYEPGTILGKGTFGTTYLATKKGTNEKFAVKVGVGRRGGRQGGPTLLSGWGGGREGGEGGR